MSGRVTRRGYSTRFMRDMRVDLVRQSGGRCPGCRQGRVNVNEPDRWLCRVCDPRDYGADAGRRFNSPWAAW